jgi:hypothetical protein
MQLILTHWALAQSPLQGGKVSFGMSPESQVGMLGMPHGAAYHGETPYMWTWPNQLQIIFSQSFVKSTVTSGHSETAYFAQQLIM